MDECPGISRPLEEKLSTLVVPGIDSAKEAEKLLENLPAIWGGANMAERRKLLLTMLDAVYVDTVEQRVIVAIHRKAASSLCSRSQPPWKAARWS